MQKISLQAVARQQLDRAADANGRRTAVTVYGGHEKVLRQSVIGLSQGARLTEHENPGGATIHVLHGRVRMTAGGQSWEARTADPIGANRPTGIAEYRVPSVFLRRMQAQRFPWRMR